MILFFSQLKGVWAVRFCFFCLFEKNKHEKVGVVKTLVWKKMIPRLSRGFGVQFKVIGICIYIYIRIYIYMYIPIVPWVQKEWLYYSYDMFRKILT